MPNGVERYCSQSARLQEAHSCRIARVIIYIPTDSPNRARIERELQMRLSALQEQLFTL